MLRFMINDFFEVFWSVSFTCNCRYLEQHLFNREINCRKTRFYSCQLFTLNVSPQTLDLLNHRLCCHLAKKFANKEAAKISTFGIAIVSMLHGCSRQCCMICFSAAAGLLVWIDVSLHQFDCCVVTSAGD